jgi:hypothetical protein
VLSELPSPPNAVTPELSVVVPCMGRLHHLKQTAPALLVHPEIEYILVDYSCPDGCGDYARRHWPRAKVVEIPGETYFNKGRALNAGIRAATGRWLANIDADNLVGPDFLRIVLSLAGEDVLVGHRAPTNMGTAFFVCRPQAFARTGGHSEAFTNWGGMDWDIRRRLLGLGLKLRLVPDDLIQILEHSDEERTRYYEIKDRWVSDRRQRRLVRFRLLPEQAVPWPDPVTFAVPAPEWREIWKTVQYGCFMQRLLGVTVCFHPYWHGTPGLDWTAAPQQDLSAPLREMIDLFGAATQLSSAGDCPPGQLATYASFKFFHPIRHFPLTPARVRWQGWTAGPRRRIAYHFEGSNAADAVNGFDSLARLLSFAAEHDLVELHSSWPLRRIAAAAAGCDLYVGLDSPITHLCYAVGIPVFLLTGALSMQDAIQWHGDRHGIWCDDLADFLRLAEGFLGAAHAPGMPVGSMCE